MLLPWNRLVAFLAAFLAALSPSSADPEGNKAAGNWNPRIAWQNSDWSSALKTAQAEQKPLMLVIHRLWCGACKALAPKFSSSQEIESLSGQFVMVSSHEEAEFGGKEFGPDGGYVPRILFFDHRGELLEDVARTQDKNRYFHFAPESIVEAMNKALEINNGRVTRPFNDEL